MKRIQFYFHLICEYMRLGILRMIQYPVDTVIMLISMLLRELIGLVGILSLTSIMGEMGGWNIYRILLLFSMCAMNEAISMAFFDGVWSLDTGVRKGRIDMYYVRPASIFIQVLGAVQHYQAVISFVSYLGLMVYAIIQLKISMTLANTLFFIEFLVCSVIINTGIYTIFNSINFWIVQGESIANFIHTCREFSKYPIHVFPVIIQAFFTFVLPFGFVGYYPALFLSGHGNEKIPIGLFIIAAFIMIVAVFVWKKGVNIYESTGN